jgi:ABC-type branched-subunit amino acid transport system substrate-binding protein
MGSSFSPGAPQVKALADEFKKRTGADINLFGMNGYEAGYLIKDAIEKAGIKNTPDSLREDRIKFRDGLEKASIVSITGEKLVFSDERDTVKAGFILTIRKGEFVEWDGKPAM